MNIFAKSALAAAILEVTAAPAIAQPLDTMARGQTPTLDARALDAAAISTWWASAAFADCPLGTLASLAACLLAALLFFAQQDATGRAADGGVLGSARVKSGIEAIRGSDTWNGRSEPKSRGYVYGFARGRYLYESGAPHVFVCGQTGSGKTRFQNIPTLDLLTFGEGGWNVVVSDIKNELIELCGDAVRARGYSVLLLDVQRPARGQRYNPLKLVCDYAEGGDLQGAAQAAEDVAAAFVPEEREGQASHWVTSARGVLAAVILYVATSDDCPRGQRHMATVCRIVNEGTGGEGDDPAAPLKALFRKLPQGHPARGFASQFLSSGGNELRSILSTLKVHLRMFASPSVAWLTSASDIDPRRVLTEKTALFLHVMDEGSPYNALFSVFFDQLYKAVYLVADSNGGKVPRRLAMLGDEWGNLPKVECLPSLLSLGRSYGISWMGSTQNIAQLNKYGERDGRRKVLANCGVKVALKLGEQEDRQYFTELVGKTTRHTQGTSASRGATSSSSTSYSEHADDVIHAWEWVEMSPERDGAIVVKQAENGVPKAHAGTFRAPLTDCTNTPTKAHFGLGTREHEAAKRLDYQRRLDECAAAHGFEIESWCPEWPAAGAGDDEPDDEWSAFDREGC